MKNEKRIRIALPEAFIAITGILILMLVCLDYSFLVTHQTHLLGSSSFEEDNGSNTGGVARGLKKRTAHLKICSGHLRTLFAPQSNKTLVSESNLRLFVQGGYEKIAKGSGNIHAAGPFLHLLSQLQFSNGIFGSLGELGVHHGRFTGFLFVTARQTEKLVAVDLFEDLQDENVDLSGKGDYGKFVNGLHSYGLDESELYQVVKGSTTDIPLDWPGNKESDNNVPFEGFRLLSVDAGHTAELTLHDLQLSFCNLLPGGIVILDDWFHPRWPGVVEGFYRFAEQEKHEQNDAVGTGVYPFLLCESKLYVTNDRKAHELYLTSILNDPVMSQWVSLIAQERKILHRKWPYEMVNGTRYVRCDSTRLPPPEQAQSLWLQRLSTTVQQPAL